MSRLRPTFPRRRAPRQAFPYRFTAKTRPHDRQGQRCRLLRGASVPECVWVEFEDGMAFIVARRALQKAEP